MPGWSGGFGLEHRLVWSGLWRHLHEEESVSGLSRKVEFEAEFEVEVRRVDTCYRKVCFRLFLFLFVSLQHDPKIGRAHV